MRRAALLADLTARPPARRGTKPHVRRWRWKLACAARSELDRERHGASTWKSRRSIANTAEAMFLLQN